MINFSWALVNVLYIVIFFDDIVLMVHDFYCTLLLISCLQFLPFWGLIALGNRKGLFFKTFVEFLTNMPWNSKGHNPYFIENFIFQACVRFHTCCMLTCTVNDGVDTLPRDKSDRHTCSDTRAPLLPTPISAPAMPAEPPNRLFGMRASDIDKELFIKLASYF